MKRVTLFPGSKGQVVVVTDGRVVTLQKRGDGLILPVTSPLVVAVSPDDTKRVESSRQRD